MDVVARQHEELAVDVLIDTAVRHDAQDPGAGGDGIDDGRRRRARKIHRARSQSYQAFRPSLRVTLRFNLDVLVLESAESVGKFISRDIAPGAEIANDNSLALLGQRRTRPARGCTLPGGGECHRAGNEAGPAGEMKLSHGDFLQRSSPIVGESAGAPWRVSRFRHGLGVPGPSHAQSLPSDSTSPAASAGCSSPLAQCTPKARWQRTSGGFQNYIGR